MTSSPSLLWAGLRSLTKLSRTRLLRVQSQHGTPPLSPEQTKVVIPHPGMGTAVLSLTMAAPNF